MATLCHSNILKLFIGGKYYYVNLCDHVLFYTSMGMVLNSISFIFYRLFMFITYDIFLSFFHIFYIITTAT